MILRCMVGVFVLISPVLAQSLPPTMPQPSAEDRKQLQAGLDELTRETDSLRKELKDRPNLLDLLPDVEIYAKAVRFPLVYGEICESAKARKALDAGMARAALLKDGKAPWVNGGGLRAYVSKIDGSVQPYMLSVPKNYHPAPAMKFRVDIFCHGRDEKLTDLNFISGKAPAAAEDHFIVHPYGRYCVANKFAGEVDLFEILDSLKKQYPIDENRIVLTGFSMGGAAVWHLATHFPDQWVAASPGAGFAETRQYQNLSTTGPNAPPWYEQRLWHLYDATDYAANLANYPLIAYHGELDKQRQSSDVMEAALAAEGLKLERIIGPGVGHKYEEKAKAELDRRLAEHAHVGRNSMPPEIHFTTWTLRYNNGFWVSLQGLEEHWKRARIDAKLIDKNAIEAKTQNISALTFSLPGNDARVDIDGQKLVGTTFVKENGKWMAANLEDGKLHKRPGLQGPIDDAFMDRFLYVVPTEKAMNSETGKWTTEEMVHAQQQWRGLMRGEVRIKRDSDVTDADIASSNLILWGDPSSNKIIARIIEKLPIRWDEKTIQIEKATFDSFHHALVMIYPNPLNPKKYIVINSGHTFREDDYRSNSRQVPTLPDYAVIDLTTPPAGKSPGKVVAAGFFDEHWQISKDAPHE